MSESAGYATQPQPTTSFHRPVLSVQMVKGRPTVRCPHCDTHLFVPAGTTQAKPRFRCGTCRGVLVDPAYDPARARVLSGESAASEPPPREDDDGNQEQRAREPGQERPSAARSPPGSPPSVPGSPDRHSWVFVEEDDAGGYGLPGASGGRGEGGTPTRQQVDDQSSGSSKREPGHKPSSSAAARWTGTAATEAEDAATGAAAGNEGDGTAGGSASVSPGRAQARMFDPEIVFREGFY